MAKEPNLIGRTFTIIIQSQFRLIMEEDDMGEGSGNVVVVDAKSIPDASHGKFEFRETS